MKYWDLDEATKIQRVEAEASFRQVFDPMNNILDFSKKRVTDSQQNAWVHLPRELGAEEETY